MASFAWRLEARRNLYAGISFICYTLFMLDPEKPIGDCSPQELIAALMLKAAFNQFDPKQVLFDLYAHQEWWKSFVMGPPLPEDAEVLDRVLLALRDLCYRWKVDTLYVLTRDDEYALPLLDLGKDWQCDHIEVIDRTRTGQLLGRHPAPPPIAIDWSSLMQLSSAPFSDGNVSI